MPQINLKDNPLLSSLFNTTGTGTESPSMPPTRDNKPRQRGKKGSITQDAEPDLTE